jgi:hypothetical protein
MLVASISCTELTMTALVAQKAPKRATTRDIGKVLSEFDILGASLNCLVCTNT